MGVICVNRTRKPVAGVVRFSARPALYSIKNIRSRFPAMSRVPHPLDLHFDFCVGSDWKKQMSSKKQADAPIRVRLQEVRNC